MTPAEELAAAADRLDALVEGASEGPWRTDYIGNPATSAIVLRGGRTRRSQHEVAETTMDADAAYIAAMSPLVGKALAEWLRQVARREPRHPYALEVARLINGTES